MSLGVEMLVEGMLLGARRVVGNDGEGTLGSDGLTEVIGIISGVGHHDLGGETFDQSAGLRGIAFLACRQDEADRTSQASDGQVYLGAQAAARASEGLIFLIFRPFFWAPLAC